MFLLSPKDVDPVVEFLDRILCPLLIRPIRSIDCSLYMFWLAKQALSDKHGSMPRRSPLHAFKEAMQSRIVGGCIPTSKHTH